MNIRITIFIWVFIVCFGFLGIRLIDIQVVHGEMWSQRAQANREFASRTPRQRAAILDRFDQPLVVNDWLYYYLDDPSALFGSTSLLSQTDGRQVMATDSARLVPGIRRWYPLGEAMAPVLGYVSGITAEDLQQNPDLTPSDFIGKQGLEAVLDKQLRGAQGEAMFEISAMGAKQRMLSSTPALVGQDVTTTLDPYISAVAYQALGDNTGAVVVADVKTGEILALVSKPTFDPNILTERLADPGAESVRKEAVASMFLNPTQLFFNRAIGGVYPPGSVFKLVTALAALESGKVTPETEVLDEGVLKVGDFSYANWYFTQHGRTEGLISLQRAIARSNDIYFYKAAEAAGPDAIARMAHAVGLGQPLGLGLPGEAGGLVPDPGWKEGVRGERWFLGNTYHMGIGQGDVLVSPVQQAQVTQTLLNLGSKCALHLIDSQEVDCVNLGLAEDQLQVVLAGMEDACSVGGTGYPFFAWNTQVRQEGLNFKEQLANGAVACKTGTAEFGGTDARGYKKTHGWFVMGMGVSKILAQSLATLSEESTASTSAQIVLGSKDLDLNYTATSAAQTPAVIERYLNHTQWLQMVQKHGFPDTIAIVVLVESEEDRPYREGSADAGPVAKKIVDWMVQ